MFASSPGAYTVSNSVAAASLAVKGAFGTMLSLVGVNAGGAQFILVFDSATLPADTDTTAVYRIPVPDGSSTPVTFSLSLAFGIPFAHGIQVCNSSTIASKTIGSANCYFTAVVR